MRALVLGFIFCIIIAIGGSAALKLAGIGGGSAPALAALAAGIAALILAAIPLLMVRGMSQMALVQAGLAATVIHLLVMLGSAAIVIFERLPVGAAFIFWLMAMYVITMIALVASIHAMQRSIAPTNPGSH